MTDSERMLASKIITHDSANPFSNSAFTRDQIRVLADFLETQNPQFNRAEWVDFVLDVEEGQEPNVYPSNGSCSKCSEQ